MRKLKFWFSSRQGTKLAPKPSAVFRHNQCVCSTNQIRYIYIVEDTYLTIAAPAEGLYKEKGSKFLAFAFPVSTPDQIQEQLGLLRKKYYDARHHCYAWRLGHELKNYRVNDDGEPSGSAGQPIFGQIRSFGLTDVLVVVVRYFGGVKLGVGGLINAYKTATADAFTQAEIIEKTVDDRIELDFDYPAMNAVMRLVKDHDLVQENTDFALRCRITLVVRRALTENICQQLDKIDQLQWNIQN